VMACFFFFQAEDGIRDFHVTGVQTCALPILRLIVRSGSAESVTGGPFGLQSIADEFHSINPIPDGRYGIGGLSYPSNQLWSLLVTWGLAFLASFVIILLMRSPWGRVIKSIREDEEVARALGKKIGRAQSE